MALFQNSVVTKYLNTQNKKTIIEQWNIYKNHFLNPTIQENIRNSKEEQYQGEFLIDLFVNVLGYNKNPTPNFNLTTELKNEKDSKKADGGILINDKVIGVIELKGTNTTDLNKIEVQAFGYKNNQKDCVYVVTSNFEKLRFYIDNAIEHIEFNLFQLTEKEFELLYLCLAYANISAHVPKKLKEESVSQEDKITKELYKDYSLFKNNLFKSLTALNPSYEPLELFKKSQKLLDRFLFLFFAEDRQLLPPNSVRLILNQWKQLQELDEYKPLYDRFKKYFEYLNTGYKGKQYDVFAYNGGLFKPDEILDNIKIDDELLYKHTLKLSEYDFASEVDVNILGHIFENSLNALDEMKAELDGTTIMKATTKRKKDGVFYTPKYITKYIVENTVGKLCTEKKLALEINEDDYFTDKKRINKTKQPLLDKLTQYRNWLLQITIIDPACGSGAFLNEALNFLISEHTYIDELQAKLFGNAMILSDVEKSILENNLFGVDLNEESVEIAKLSLWLRTAQPNRKLNDLNSNIKCGNSLIDDVTIAGEKAFNWQKEFPQIFKLKQPEAYHLVFTTHNSRTSQRMIDYKVQKGHPVEFNLEQEIAITEIYKEIIKENNYKVLAYNICKDHVHIIIVCEFEELNTIAQKLKGVSSRKYSSKGFKPLGEPLWSQKFYFADLDVMSPAEISYRPGYCFNDTYLNNATKYIENNRDKHNLPYSKELEKLISEFVISQEQAFGAEYKGGFDVVIGNPPYVPTEYISEDDKIYLEKIYQSAYGRINLYPIFYEKGLKVLKDSGVLGYITPYTILKNQYYKESRKFILENSTIIELIDFKGILVFQDAAVDSIILILEKKISDYYEFKQISNIKFFENQSYTVDKFKLSEILSNEDLSMLITINDKLIKRVSKNTIPLKEIINFNQGIITGGNSKYLTTEKSEITEKVLTGSDFNRYLLNDTNQLIRYDAKELHRPRKREVFEASEKILLRQTGAYPICMIDNEKYFTLDTVHNGLLINDKFDIKFILSILNSNLLRFLYESRINEGGKVFAQVKIIYIDPLPIKKISLIEQKPFIEKADQMLSLSKEFQLLANKFQRTIQRKFFNTDDDNGLKPIGKKLQDWYMLSYADFIKELGKLKVKLTLAQEAEWEDYFTQEAAKVLALKNEIDTTDKTIDKMVYELYGLSDEEIAIVEGA